MLDTGYWISRNAPGVKSGNIQHPACQAEALKERRLESRIQDHVIFPVTLIETP
jgi:hypothetical protein